MTVCPTCKNGARPTPCPRCGDPSQRTKKMTLEIPAVVDRIVALLAAAVVNGGRGNVADGTTLEMAKKFEAYLRG